MRDEFPEEVIKLPSNLKENVPILLPFRTIVGLNIPFLIIVV